MTLIAGSSEYWIRNDMYGSNHGLSTAAYETFQPSSMAHISVG